MGDNSGGSVWLVLLLIIIAWPLSFLVLWSAILWVMAALGGWRRLSRLYAAPGLPLGGQQFSWISGMIGIARYNRTLIITTNDAGMHIRTRRIFRFSHPPLFIPWRDIHNPQRSSFLRWEYIGFDIGAPALARMKLQAAVFEGTPVAAAMLSRVANPSAAGAK
jgi:hypothetical protein